MDRGDCCAIPIPSVFTAARVDRKDGCPGTELGGPGIRPVSFDKRHVAPLCSCYPNKVHVLYKS